MANGLVVTDTAISVGGRSVLGANLGRVQVGSITHTSDTAIATQASGGTQIGSAISMVIPAAGVVRLTILEIEYDETEGNAAEAQVGLKIGTDSIIWGAVDLADSSVNVVAIRANASAVSVLGGSGWAVGGGGAVPEALIVTFDVVANSMSTGTQDTEVWFGDNVASNTGEITITGSTVTARFLVEVIDGT